MGDSNRGIHSESAVERVSGRDLRYIRLGDVRVVKENIHGARKQIVIARIPDGALERKVLCLTLNGTDKWVPT